MATDPSTTLAFHSGIQSLPLYSNNFSIQLVIPAISIRPLPLTPTPHLHDFQRYPDTFTLSSFLSLPPFPSLDFPFSFVGFEVFDLTPGYLSKNSLISMSSTRTLHSWLTISVLTALKSAGCLAISASQCLPPSYTSQVPCSDSTSGPWTPWPSPLWLLIWESTLFHQVHSPYRQPFQGLSGLDAASKTPRPHPDRTLGKRCKQRLRPCRVGDNLLLISRPKHPGVS